MLDSKQGIGAILAFVLLVTFVTPVLAVEYNPGVRAGDYVKYGNYEGVNAGNFSWEKKEVVAVSGKTVTLLTTGQYKNGTNIPSVGVTFVNLETGETNETHSDLKSVIAAELQQGDLVPPGKLAVNRTEIRTYVGGVSRTVNVLVEEFSLGDLNVRATAVYDKVSGMALEWENWATRPPGIPFSIQYNVVETNLWEVSSPPPQLETLYFVLAAAVIAIAIAITVVVVIRKRKRPGAKTQMMEAKAMDLTYNLSGVIRGECYLADSLGPCVKVVCELHTRGVSALAIVREDPEYMTKTCNLKPDDVVLLSSQPIKGFKAMSSLQEISIAVTKFVKAGGGVVLLDGLEYLISRFGFNTVYMMLQEKHIEFLAAGTVLLVPVNMETLDSREKGQLLSELKLL
jgi:hypothetical protein